MHFTAIVDVRDKYSRLHGDVSIGNIILVREHDSSGPRRGYLIDWDASCEVDAAGESYKEGRIVSAWTALLLTSLTFFATGNVGVHVSRDVGTQRQEPQTHVTGRYGILALRGLVLRVSLAEPQAYP